MSNQDPVSYFLRKLAYDEKVYGSDHPEVAIDLYNLAVLYGWQEKYSDAEPLYRRALAYDEKVYGSYHPEVATDLNNLAKLYRAQGRYAEAVPLFKRVLLIRFITTWQGILYLTWEFLPDSWSRLLKGKRREAKVLSEKPTELK